jgi:hypothetical protein
VTVPGDSIDKPQITNLATPQGYTTLCGMKIDKVKLAEVCDRLGVDKYDVISIAGYRNAKGELVPDYDSVKVERKHV